MIFFIFYFCYCIEITYLYFFFFNKWLFHINLDFNLFFHDFVVLLLQHVVLYHIDMMFIFRHYAVTIICV